MHLCSKDIYTWQGVYCTLGDNKGVTMRTLLWGLMAMTCLGLLEGCATSGGVAQSEHAAKPAPRYSTAGTSLTYEEIERTVHRTRHEDIAVRYRLNAKGFPRDKQYSLWVERFVGGRPESQEAIKQLRVREDEVVTTHLGRALEFVFVRYREQATDPDVLTGVPEGRSLILTLVSNDRSVESWVKMVPFPIEAFGKEGCRLAVESESADRSMVTIIGESFEPNEMVEVLAKSDGETIRFSEQAAGDGRFLIAMFPHVRGKQHGATDVTATSKKCTATIRFHWGD